MANLSTKRLISVDCKREYKRDEQWITDAQDQVLDTKYDTRVTLKIADYNAGRTCQEFDETTIYVVAGCVVLAGYMN
jgi:hypothetical protein